ncbi:MAG: putative metal-binding motif-containing protein [Patescibacteria group bacterium]|jgi:hypothetical protein
MFVLVALRQEPCPSTVDDDGDGVTEQSGDCNDASAAVYPGATETCDGMDNNCDSQVDEGVQTTYYLDYDGDGYGNHNASQVACAQPTGYVTDNTDCQDHSSWVYPGAQEICDGLDGDCDGIVDDLPDADGDGYGSCDGDCDDANPDIVPEPTIYVDDTNTVQLNVRWCQNQRTYMKAVFLSSMNENVFWTRYEGEVIQEVLFKIWEYSTAYTLYDIYVETDADETRITECSDNPEYDLTYEVFSDGDATSWYNDGCL